MLKSRKRQKELMDYGLLPVSISNQKMYKRILIRMKGWYPGQKAHTPDREPLCDK